MTTTSSSASIAKPRRPELVARYERGGRKAVYYRSNDGIEAVVAGGTITACKGRGKVKEGPASVLRGKSAVGLGDAARMLLEGPGGTPIGTKGLVTVFVAYTHAGGVCCWSRERDVAAASAKRRQGFVRAFMVPAFRDTDGPQGIPEHVAPPWRTSDHPRGGTTEIQSVLLPKAKFPTQADAALWLVAQKKPFRADRIEDSGRVKAGNYWSARQHDPRRGVRYATIPFGQSGILARIEAKGTPKQAADGDREAMLARPRASKGTSKARPGPVVLVGSSKTQLDTGAPVPASKRYTSALFVDSLAYARKLTLGGGTVRILSGKHGLLKPTTKVKPHDETLAEMSAAERRAWGRRVLRQLLAEFGSGPRTFICLAGDTYAKTIYAAGPPATWDCKEPLKGEANGVRLTHVRRLLAAR
jgi:hypothetical protein